MTDLLLRRAREAFRDQNDYDVVSDGKKVGRIFRPGAGAPRDLPWFWTITAWPMPDTVRKPYLGYTETRADAMSAFAKSWRG
jgi:hypothetical protein